jgi:hypothetical protein
MIFIAVCFPVLMMLLVLGMDVFENFLARPSSAPLEAGDDLPSPSARQPD